MDAAGSPRTLPAVAAKAGIPEEDLLLYDADDFGELIKELGIPVTVRVHLKKQHRDLLSAEPVKARFQKFLERVHGAEALAGLEHVPVSSLPTCVSFIKDRPDIPT
eukprot:COSAG04_NODE_10571_length_768_cov_0.931241_1_plen_105_part_01